VLKLFAKRYIFSNKSTKAINIISWISVAAIAVGTAAIIIVLSSYNGIDSFVRKLYTSFYTDVKIEAKQGKFFEQDETLIQKIRGIKGVRTVGLTLEEKILLSNEKMQQVAVLKGVDSNYEALTNFSRFIRYGDTILADDKPRLILGLGIANNLHVTENAIAPLGVFAFTGKGNLTTSPQDAYQQADMFVSGIFSVQDEFDTKYALCNMAQAQELLQKEQQISSIEISLDSSVNTASTVKAIEDLLLNSNLVARTRFEQNKTLYYILKSEKWMTYAVLCFMLLIASFNLVASLSMLALEKQRDVSILKSLGAEENDVRKIFLSTGIGIGLLGGLIGLVIGFVVCFLQQRYGIFEMQGEDLLIQAYPIRIIASDFLLVFATDLIISLLAAWVPAAKASKAPLRFGRG
jgi:lipoprotein-releasing system permease protein